MSLTEKDVAAVKSLWAKISGSADAIGADAIVRLLRVFPQTKTYFSHWPDLSAGSASVRNHGKKVMAGVALAVKSLNNLNKGLVTLSELHAFQLRVDPANFKLLSHCIMVVIATMFPADFTPEVHIAMDKFMTCVALALSEKYR